MVGCSGVGDASTQQPLGRIPINSVVNRNSYGIWYEYIHPKALAKIASEVDAHAFHSRWTAFIFTPKYSSMTSVILFD